MLTKKQFYAKFKIEKLFFNKYAETCCVYNFNEEGIKCELWFRLTSVYNPSEKKGEWYISLQLINKKAEKISHKYICSDVYDKLANLKINSDYKAWKFIEKWVIDNVKTYKIRWGLCNTKKQSNQERTKKNLK